MGLNRFSKTISFFRFLLVSFVFIVFSCCNSSTQIASSFSKRKYTKGHFNQRGAKLKTEYPAYIAAAADISTISPLSKTETTVKPFTVGISVQPAQHGAQVLPRKVCAANGSINLTQKNIYIKEKPVYTENTGEQGHFLPDSDRMHKPHLLALFVICLLLGLLFLALATIALGFIFLLFAWGAFILAAVFLVLCLLALIM